MSSSKDQTPPSESLLSRAFPLLLKYAGLAMGLYEGFIDRPPHIEVILLSLTMIAGIESIQAYIGRRA